MLEEKKFCVCCGQKLSTKVLSNLIHRSYFEFDDGLYCETCARERVKKKRGGKT
jgi:superfamily II helicase